MILTMITAPTEEPVSLPEIEGHLRITSEDEKLTVAGYAMAARQLAEMMSHRALITQTLELALESWPTCDRIQLPRPPLQAVTWVKYVDSNGVTQTMAADDYLVDTASQPGQVIVGYGKSWPSATLRPGPAITVRYTAGYGTASQVPAIYKQAVLLMIGHFYENREEVTPGNVRLQQAPLAARLLLTVDRGGW